MNSSGLPAVSMMMMSQQEAEVTLTVHGGVPLRGLRAVGVRGRPLSYFCFYGDRFTVS